MIELEKQKAKFAKHKATFTDYGNIKILDFKNPDSSDYRIRFLFEEDYCRLHISGDLGELVATNYNNMTFNSFGDFVRNPYYFESKIDCHSRDLYYYDEDAAKEQIFEHFGGKEELIFTVKASTEYWLYNDGDDEMLEDFFDDVFEEFDIDRGISSQGMTLLAKLTDDDYSLYEEHFGRKRTGIVELYLYAFELALKQLKEREKE